MEPELQSHGVRERDKSDNTLPKLANCVDCNQQFRTYVPNTDCLLPDGNLVYYKESQTLCQECSGAFLSINE